MVVNIWNEQRLSAVGRAAEATSLEELRLEHERQHQEGLVAEAVR